MKAEPESDRYYANVNTDLLAIVPAGTALVYEFGCGQGRLGARYKSQNPKSAYIGIELHEDAQSVAAGLLDAAHRGNAEDPALTDALLRRHGVGGALVYGDILEHLVDPWAAFEDHLRLLAPEGSVCICIPNAQHWTFSLNLAAGSLEYADQGLHDRTHLRFFTRRSIGNFLTRFGFEQMKLRRRRFGEVPPFVGEIAAALAARTRAEPTRLHDDLTTLQYVIQATRRPPARRLYVDLKRLEDKGGFNFIRADAPARRLDSLPGVHVQAHDREARISDRSRHPSIFLWQRPILRLGTDIANIRRLQQRRKLIVTDFDDDPGIWPEIAENANLSFAGAHAVQVSTEPLAEKLAAFNPNIVVQPNRIPALEPYDVVRARGEPGAILIGGFNRGGDVEAIAETLNAFVARDPQRWKFLIVGDRSIHEMIRAPRKRLFPVLSYADYLGVLQRCEFALLPLRDTPANRLKSDLKFLEAAASATLTIAAELIYGEAVEHDRTGLLFDSPETLADILERLAGGEDFEAMRRRAYDFVREHRMLSDGIGEIVETWHRLYARYDELDAALNARLTALAGAVEDR